MIFLRKSILLSLVHEVLYEVLYHLLYATHDTAIVYSVPLHTLHSISIDSLDSDLKRIHLNRIRDNFELSQTYWKRVSPAMD